MKMMKKLFALLLVICMVLSMSACGGNNDKKDDEQNDNKVNVETDNDKEDDKEEEKEQPSFKVTVVDQNGDPVKGVMIQVCKEFCMPGMTNEEGVYEFAMEIEDGHKLQLSKAPEGYTYEGEADIYLEPGQTEYTMELKKAE